MKLYHVIQPASETMFVSEQVGKALQDEAIFFLKEENKYGRNVSLGVQIIEVTSVDNIPLEWRGEAYLWNIEDEVTASQFLEVRDPEYREYLRLKNKFG